MSYTDKETMKELLQEKSFEQIAKNRGVAPSSVRYWARKHGLDKEYQEKEKLREMYIEQDMTQREIAERYGVTPQCISHWFQRHNMTQFRKEKSDS